MLINDSRTSCGETVRSVGAHHIAALLIDVLHPELRIVSRLVWVRGWSGQIIKVEAREELILRRKFVVDAQRKLVSIRIYLRSGRIRVDSERAGGKIRHWISRKRSRNSRLHRNHQRVYATVGIAMLVILMTPPPGSRPLKG